MLTDYKLDKIFALLKDFHEITGYKIGICEADFNDLDGSYSKTYGYENYCGFCKLMRNEPALCKKCIESDIYGMEQAKKTKRMTVYRCHAGLVETCTPIIDGDSIIGYFFIGQLYLGKEVEKQEAKTIASIKNYIQDISLAEKYIKQIKKVKPEQLSSVSTIMQACIMYIVYEQLLNTEHGDLWQRVKEYINNNYNKNISLETISRDLHISVSTLCKAAKNHGTTIGRYITKIRIDKAKHYFETTQMAVGEISEKVGITDYNYFSRMFKKHAGMTPTQYISKIQKR